MKLSGAMSSFEDVNVFRTERRLRERGLLPQGSVEKTRDLQVVHSDAFRGEERQGVSLFFSVFLLFRTSWAGPLQP